DPFRTGDLPGSATVPGGGGDRSPAERRGAPVLPSGPAVPPAPPPVLARGGDRPAPGPAHPPVRRRLPAVLDHAGPLRVGHPPADRSDLPRAPVHRARGRLAGDGTDVRRARHRAPRAGRPGQPSPGAALVLRSPLHAARAHRPGPGAHRQDADADWRVTLPPRRRGRRRGVSLGRGAAAYAPATARSAISALWSLPRSGRTRESVVTRPCTSTWSIRKSRGEPAHGPQVRPGRRPSRRAASTAA